MSGFTEQRICAILLPHRGHSVGVLLRRYHHDSKQRQYGRVVWETVPEERNIESASDPFTFFMEEDDGCAQQLMDDLYRAGFRPKDGSGSVGQLSAVQEHVKDLRLIAFNALNIKA